MLISRKCLAMLVCSASVLMLAGCQENEEIRRYSVEKLARLDSPTAEKPTDRLLAAIVPRSEQT